MKSKRNMKTTGSQSHVKITRFVGEHELKNNNKNKQNLHNCGLHFMKYAIVR